MTYYNRNTHRRQSRPPRGPRANRYPGPCATCGDEVPAGAGLLEGGQASGWTVKHRPAAWSGSPVSGWYAGGCPRDTAALNASGGWGPESARTYTPAAPLQAGPDDDLREVSRRAGSKYAYTSSGARMTMSSQRCEDAPCCGCC